MFSHLQPIMGRAANRPIFPGTSHILTPLSHLLANASPGRRMSHFSQKMEEWLNFHHAKMQDGHLLN